jgi:hypothetical protein|tara:strand:+ start:1166 stop:4357 length:3192 start_codon:yes stop_codon:yes gene_type:complete
MATYVPGADNILPDIQPFTPDYKFLSAVLDTRQDKYSTNWKATNDVYNKVVYADLSREDNKEQRDQYVQNLAPSLEKIAGMDLSLAQNADSAKAVFAPFFEDKLMVKDIVFTSNYRKEMDYANRLLDSPNREQQEKWWGPGVKALQYKMEDFVNGTADQAMNSGLPKYVEDADLFETAQKILGEMKPPLKMSATVSKKNPDGSIDPMFNIEQQNGDLVVGPALQFIQKALQDNPRVQQAYQTQAYVASRDFAAEGIAAGTYGSVQEGQQAWATETISRIEAVNDARLPKTQAKVQELENINLRWSDYQKNTGIIPGSDEDKSMKKQMNSYEQVKATLENQMQVQDLLQTPIAEGSEGTLNRAYQLLMGANMMGDMVAAAQNFSMRGFEAKLVETPYSKFKYDMSKQNARAADARNLEAIKLVNRRQLAKEKGELMFDERGNPLFDYFGSESYRTGDASTAGYEVDKDGKIDADFNVVLNGTTIPYVEEKEKINVNQVDAITKALLILKPEGDDGNQNYTIEVDGKEVTGNIDLIKTALLDKDETTGVLKNQNLIDELYDNYSTTILNTTALKEKDPGLVARESYKNLKSTMAGLNQQTTSLEQFVQSAYRDQKDTYDAVKASVIEDKDIKAFMDAGMPDIWETDENGILSPYTREQYIAEVARLAELGEVTNYNKSWQIDKGTNEKNYMKQATEYVASPSYTGTLSMGVGGGGYYEPIFNADGTPKMVVDMTAVENEAGEVYDALQKKMNQGLTGSLGDGNTYKTATLKSKMTGAGNTAADLISNPTYVAAIDPKAPNAAGNEMASNLFNQLDALAQKGIQPMFVQGSLNNVEGDIEGGFTQGQRTLEMFKADLRSYINNPKSPNSPSAMPRATIEYMPVYGATDDGEKSTAGYRIKFNADWLASKVKGGSDPSNQYGAITSDQFESLSDGVSVVYEQKNDISPRSNMNSMDYFSPVLSGIAANPNGYYQPPEITDELGDEIGTYRFVKVSDQEYMLNWKFNNYQEGGTYTTTSLFTRQILIGPEGPGRTLDDEEALTRIKFAQRGADNVRAKRRDIAINGKK